MEGLDRMQGGWDAQRAQEEWEERGEGSVKEWGVGVVIKVLGVSQRRQAQVGGRGGSEQEWCCDGWQGWAAAMGGIAGGKQRRDGER